MSNRQRVHYVIAKSHEAAEPIVKRLKSQGLKKAIPVTTIYGLLGVNPKESALVLVPGWEDSRDARKIGDQIMSLVRKGIVTKPVPRAPEPKPEPQKTLPTPKTSVGGGYMRSADVLDALLGTSKKIALKTAPIEDKIQPVNQPSKYKQVYLGGPRHGQQVREPVLPYQTEIRAVEVEPGPIDYFSIRSTIPFRESVYRKAEFAFLGENIIFWIDTRQWSDRQRLVRDFMLFPLEK
ncbi:hypothetical protein [Microbispora sp. NPDC049633]|uniref:hypothetical protein n=1 Tax=Microbispora sp. NPDC049633 TaxID=3154355 RepID=UPI003433DA52